MRWLGFLIAIWCGVIPTAALAGTPHWVQLVDPLLTSAEKKAYQALKPAEQDRFEKEFWNDKPISAEEYFERVHYTDLKFGSSKPGSGANTDQGRVYLTLGPPAKVTHLPSSRLFVPLEIWYYDAVPGVIDTEVRLLFYEKNSLGLPKLYSPNVDTIRALLLPEAATVHLFGPNDTMDEATIRTNLRVPPVEDEVISAAVAVANGIRDVGNDELLGHLASPRAMLRPELTPHVRSRLISGVPKLTSILTRSAYGGTQADLSVETSARNSLTLDVFQGDSTIYRSSVDLKLDAARSVQYLSRVDLLPGKYRVMVGVDGNMFPFALDVPAEVSAGPLVRASEARRGHETSTPFRFDDRSYYPADDGDSVVWPLPQAGEVTWTIRSGLQVVWKAKSLANDAAALTLPFGSLARGKYQLEASSGSATQFLSFDTTRGARTQTAGTLVSYNANLTPNLRYTLIGEQRVLRGELKEARRVFMQALASAPSPRTEIDLARVEALEGMLDSARDRLQPMLAAEPRNFDALCVLAYIEAKLQDFAVAAELYHRALDVHDSATVRMALAELHN